MLSSSCSYSTPCYVNGDSPSACSGTHLHSQGFYFDLWNTNEPAIDILLQTLILPVVNYTVLSALSIGLISDTVWMTRTTIDIVQMAEASVDSVQLAGASIDMYFISWSIRTDSMPSVFPARAPLSGCLNANSSSIFVIYVWEICSGPRPLPVSKRDTFLCRSSFSPVQLRVLTSLYCATCTFLFSYFWPVWSVFCSQFLLLLA